MNNRFWNARNNNQGDFKTALCVCSAGLLRSPTLAWVLSNPPFNFNTRAAGSSQSFAMIPVDNVLLHWADFVFFVNKENQEEVAHSFDLEGKHVITLNIPDNFRFRDPKLVEIIQQQLDKARVDFQQQTGNTF